MLHKYYEQNAAGSEGELILMVIVRPEYRMISLDDYLEDGPPLS